MDFNSFNQLKNMLATDAADYFLKHSKEASKSKNNRNNVKWHTFHIRKEGMEIGLPIVAKEHTIEEMKQVISKANDFVFGNYKIKDEKARTPYGTYNLFEVKDYEKYNVDFVATEEVMEEKFITQQWEFKEESNQYSLTGSYTSQLFKGIGLVEALFDIATNLNEDEKEDKEYGTLRVIK